MTEPAVLVVDPDRESRARVKSLLRGQGRRVLEAAGALEALAVCACRPVEAVVTELDLPGIGGEALAAALSERFPAVLVIALSARPIESPPAGIAEVLGKPVPAAALLACLHRRLAAPPKKQAAAAASRAQSLRKQG
jgi:CheY-like chemotaxis protein